MSYELSWRRSHPGHLVYLVDISGSTGRQINGTTPLIDIIIGSLNKLFSSLISQCEAGDNYLNYFSVTVIGYNSDIVTLYKGKTSEEVADFFFDSQARGYLFDTSKEAKPQWQTYMADAFDAAAKDIEEWMKEQRAAGKPVPAPVVINITDGVPEENGLTYEQAREKALAAAKRLKAIKGDDGNLLFFNVHFSPDSAAPTIALPSAAPTDTAVRFLYEASSPLPEKSVERARQLWADSNVGEQSRFMISNEKDPKRLLQFIDFGSSLSMPGGEFGSETAKPD